MCALKWVNFIVFKLYLNKVGWKREKGEREKEGGEGGRKEDKEEKWVMVDKVISLDNKEEDQKIFLSLVILRESELMQGRSWEREERENPKQAACSQTDTG